MQISSGNIPTPDWYYREVNLDGTQDLVNSGLKLFGTAITEWTMFYYIDDFPADAEVTSYNHGAIYNGVTQFNVTGEKGYGTNIRYSQNSGYYVDKINKTIASNVSRAYQRGYAIPFAFKRVGSNFYWSNDGVTWTYLMNTYYTGNANNTLTIGINAWNGNYRPTVDGVLEVAVWLNDVADISDYFGKYK